MLNWAKWAFFAVCSLSSVNHVEFAFSQGVIYVDDDAPGGEGTSWASAFSDLSQALTVAGSGSAVTEIRVGQGTYFPAPHDDAQATFQLADGVAVRGGYAGFGAIDPDQRNFTAYETVLSGLRFGQGPGQPNRVRHVVIADGTGPSAVIEGFTISDGFAFGACGTFDCIGGGMRIVGGSPTITDCNFVNNRAVTFGGAIHVGGLFGPDQIESAPHISRCSFVNNKSSTGGAIMYLLGGRGTLQDSLFLNNSADDSLGGAIFAANSNDLSIADCVFVGNTAIDQVSGSGGALYIVNFDEALIANCALVGNQAFGTFWYSGGGGIFIDSSTSNIRMVNTTLYANWSQTTSGGIRVANESPMVENCILWANASDNPSLSVREQQISYFSNPEGVHAPIVSYSCVQDDASNDSDAYPGVGNIDADPLVLQAPDDGGDGWGVGSNDDYGDLHLGPASPCIDAGDNAAVPSSITTDLDGLPRFVDIAEVPDSGNGSPPIVDLGAFEYNDDCNGNGVEDALDISSGASQDANGNGVPDECEECQSDAGCDDGRFCNGMESCTSGTCTPGEPPCGLLECDELTDACVSCTSDTGCDDGLFCNGVEHCISGSCQPGSQPCPGAICNEQQDRCDDCANTNDCSDGLYCNGVESCVAGTCVSGTDPCPEQACSEFSQACFGCLTDYDCNDFLYCNGLESCSAGVCQAGTDPCPGALCNENVNACAECISDSQCNDEDDCTADYCVALMCVFVPIDPCGEGFADEPGADSDGDGLSDDVDQCPNTPAGQVVNDVGCACSELDSDHDGVNDCADQCPGTPAGSGVGPNGCPADPIAPDDGDDGFDSGDSTDETDTTDSGSAPDEEGAAGAIDNADDGSPEPDTSAANPPGRDAAEQTGEAEEPSPEPAGTQSNQPAGSPGAGCGLFGMIPLMLFTLGWGALRWTRSRK